MYPSPRVSARRFNFGTFRNSWRWPAFAVRFGCQGESELMEKEMRTRPLKIAAFSLIGTLGVAALVLFVVLEIQWIRFWSVQIKNRTVETHRRESFIRAISAESVS